jgi:catechol-2,3-dioxygenase
MAQTTLDLGGIVWLEHVNLVVGNKALAEQFYFDFLGMTRDSGGSFHANLGQQQFHLAENGEPAQRVTGSIGLAVPSLDTLRKRVATAIDAFQGTQFKLLDDENGCMTITCPWGNRLHLYDVQDDTCQPLTSDSSQKMVKFHAEGGTYGAHRMAVRGNPGIRYLEISCRSGTAPAIAAFYRDMLSCTVSTPTPHQALVSIGPGVHLVYSETDALTEDALQQMEGVHICIYVNDFKGLYQRLKERSLIWTNPRFVHLDSCDTWEEALASRTLRFKDIRDLKNDEPLLELEHEIRPLRHGQYLKVPNYDPK